MILKRRIWSYWTKANYQHGIHIKTSLENYFSVHDDWRRVGRAGLEPTWLPRGILCLIWPFFCPVSRGNTSLISRSIERKPWKSYQVSKHSTSITCKLNAGQGWRISRSKLLPAWAFPEDLSDWVVRIPSWICYECREDHIAIFPGT